MINVHDIFICKPGQASKVAKMFKESMADSPGFIAIMTDMTGQYHRVIMIASYDSLAEYEKSFELYKNPTKKMKESMAKMDGLHNMYVSGSREIYKVW